MNFEKIDGQNLSDCLYQTSVFGPFQDNGDQAGDKSLCLLHFGILELGVQWGPFLLSDLPLSQVILKYIDRYQFTIL